MTNTDIDVLQSEYENAKERIKQQREELKEFSREGLQIFRLSILLVGVPATVLGAFKPNSLSQLIESATSSTCVVSEFCLPTYMFTYMAFVAYLFGVLLNIMASGYESRGAHNISNPEDINKITSSNDSLMKYYHRRLKTYEKRITHNDRLLHVEESVLTGGKITLSFAVLFAVPPVFKIVTGSLISGYLLLLFY